MSSEQAYITFLGRSSWALLNCYYAVLRETAFRPTEIVICSEEPFAEKISAIKEGLTIISDAYGISPQITEILLKDADFGEACTWIPQAIKERKSRGVVVALDITSGRKALIAGALIAVPRDLLDYVFYLAITTTEGMEKPYLMIPLQLQKLKDFRAAIESCTGAGYES
ncbi:MAG: hypothetical protein LUO93_11055 [Methanomicrobiales archaeon]|nr:hypothetical protein [Methanomicrobiales archaeon]